MIDSRLLRFLKIRRRAAPLDDAGKLALIGQWVDHPVLWPDDDVRRAAIRMILDGVVAVPPDDDVRRAAIRMILDGVVAVPPDDDAASYMTTDSVGVPCRWDANGRVLEKLGMSGVHERQRSCDVACVVHNPTGHHMSRWPLNWRPDRNLFERVCAHGVGHPDPDQMPFWRATGLTGRAVHACCGCCREGDYDDWSVL